MNQEKEKDNQVLYLGRWVSQSHFRTFIYNESGQRLVNSYDEYMKAIESGLWFSEKEDIGKGPPVNAVQSKPGRKPKHGADS